MTRRTITIIQLVEEEASDAPPSSRSPARVVDTDGEEITSVRPTLRGLAKAGSRLAEVVPLFRKAAG